MVVHQVIEQRSIQNGGGIELLPRDGGADNSKDPRTDHRTDAQRGQRPGAKRFLKTVLGELRVADQLVDRFGCEQLLSQRLGSLSYAMLDVPIAEKSRKDDRNEPLRDFVEPLRS